eukprot:1108053-Pelagomonas_calceolata.AAC.1
MLAGLNDLQLRGICCVVALLQESGCFSHAGVPVPQVQLAELFADNSCHAHVTLAPIQTHHSLEHILLVLGCEPIHGCATASASALHLWR